MNGRLPQHGVIVTGKRSTKTSTAAGSSQRNGNNNIMNANQYARPAFVSGLTSMSTAPTAVRRARGYFSNSDPASAAAAAAAAVTVLLPELAGAQKSSSTTLTRKIKQLKIRALKQQKQAAQLYTYSKTATTNWGTRKQANAYCASATAPLQSKPTCDEEDLDRIDCSYIAENIEIGILNTQHDLTSLDLDGPLLATATSSSSPSPSPSAGPGPISSTVRMDALPQIPASERARDVQMWSKDHLEGVGVDVDVDVEQDEECLVSTLVEEIFQAAPSSLMTPPESPVAVEVEEVHGGSGADAEHGSERHDATLLHPPKFASLNGAVESESSSDASFYAARTQRGGADGGRSSSSDTVAPLPTIKRGRQRGSPSNSVRLPSAVKSQSSTSAAALESGSDDGLPILREKIKHRLKRVSVSGSGSGSSSAAPPSSSSFVDALGTAKRLQVAASLRSTRSNFPMVKLDESLQLEYMIRIDQSEPTKALVDEVEEIEVDAAANAPQGWAAIRKRVQQRAIAQAVANAFPEHAYFSMQGLASAVAESSKKRASARNRGAISNRVVAALAYEAMQMTSAKHAEALGVKGGHPCLTNEAAVAGLGHLHRAFQLMSDPCATRALRTAARRAAAGMMGSFLLCETLGESSWARDEHVRLVKVSRAYAKLRSRDVEQSVFRDERLAEVLAPIAAGHAISVADALIRTAAPVVHDAQSVWSGGGSRSGDRRTTDSFKKLTALVSTTPIAKAVDAVVKPARGTVLENAELPAGTFTKLDAARTVAVAHKDAAAARPSVVVQFTSPLEVKVGYNALVAAFGEPLEAHNLFDPEFNALHENRGLRSLTLVFRYEPTQKVLNRKHRPQVPSPEQCGHPDCHDKNLVEGQDCLTTECYEQDCGDRSNVHAKQCHFHKNCVGVAFVQSRPCPCCGGAIDAVKPTAKKHQKAAKFVAGGRKNWGQLFDEHIPGKALEVIRVDAGNAWSRVKAAASSSQVRNTAVSTVFDVEILLPAYTMLRQELAVPCRIAGKGSWIEIHDEFKASD